MLGAVPGFIVMNIKNRIRYIHLFRAHTRRRIVPQIFEIFHPRCVSVTVIIILIHEPDREQTGDPGIRQKTGQKMLDRRMPHPQQGMREPQIGQQIEDTEVDRRQPLKPPPGGQIPKRFSGFDGEVQLLVLSQQIQSALDLLPGAYLAHTHRIEAQAIQIHDLFGSAAIERIDPDDDAAAADRAVREEEGDVLQRFVLARRGDGIFEVEGDGIGFGVIDPVEVFEIEGVEHHVGAMPPVRAGGFGHGARLLGEGTHVWEDHRLVPN